MKIIPPHLNPIPFHFSNLLSVDGPNFEKTLRNVYRHWPRGDEWPNWETVLSYFRASLLSIEATYCLNANSAGPVIFGKMRALKTMGFSDVKLLDKPEHGFDAVDPVDDHIRWCHQLAVEAQLNTKRRGSLILVGHDHGYLPELKRALSAGLNVYLVGFLEMPKTEFLELKTLGAKLLDLEFDLKAFNRPLPNRPRESVVRAIINRIRPHVGCYEAAKATSSDFLRSGEKDIQAFAENQA